MKGSMEITKAKPLKKGFVYFKDRSDAVRAMMIFEERPDGSVYYASVIRSALDAHDKADAKVKLSQRLENAKLSAKKYRSDRPQPFKLYREAAYCEYEGKCDDIYHTNPVVRVFKRRAALKLGLEGSMAEFRRLVGLLKGEVWVVSLLPPVPKTRWVSA